MCTGGMREEVEFLLIMASLKHVVLPAGAYLNLTVIYRTRHKEETTKVGSAVDILVEFPPEKKTHKSRITFLWCFSASHLGGTEILTSFISHVQGAMHVMSFCGVGEGS